MDRLDAMLENVRSFVREREWESFHDPKNLAMAIASEAGELCAELRWVSNAEADAFLTDADARRRVVDELADVAICMFMLADRVGVDVPEIVADKLARIRDRYPVELTRGRADVPPKR